MCGQFGKNHLGDRNEFLPTLVAAVGGDPDLRENARKGVQAGNKFFKVYIDDYNQLPLLTGKTDKGARNEFFYFSDDGENIFIRYNVLPDKPFGANHLLNYAAQK